MALRHAIGRQAQRRDGDHVGTVQREQAMRGAHELDVGPAVGQLVAHDLGDRQLGQRLVDRLLQAFGQRRARLLPVEEKRFCATIHFTSKA